MAYKATNGKVYDSYKDYCNSDDIDWDVACVMLATGRRTPQNEEERRWLKSVNEAKSKGIGIEFPFN